MAIELEAKIKVEQLDDSRVLLGKLGARHVAELTQRDRFYDCEDRKLLANDSGLRIRQVSSDGQQEVLMCFKGPRQGGVFKRREEIEFAVGDLESAGQFLEALGFSRSLEVSKQRSLWELRGCDVCLDEVEQLGCFVEVEGKDEQVVAEVLRMLGLADEEVIHCSYAEMLS